jgi:diguanylate cyclase (GGDEF)-like protein
MDQNGANAGYALLDDFGRLVAADEILRRWWGDRELIELLPEFEFNGEATSRQRTKLCPQWLEPLEVTVECRRLIGQTAALFLLRVEIPGYLEAAPEYRDAITGLPDRRALAAHRANLLREANGKLPYAVLFMDLDHFKQINDAWGHAVGDQVLTILAERWRKSLRGWDLLVRYGGDEFVVLLAGVRAREEVQPIIDRLQAVTNAPISIGDQLVEINVAIGVALAEDAAIPLEELMDEADRAMYAAKRQTE